MRVQGRHYRTIWEDGAGGVRIIDQRRLPHEFVEEVLADVGQVAEAIRDMHVRGAGLIGVTAAYGMALAAVEAVRRGDGYLREAAEFLVATRPTAVNLAWAVERQITAMAGAGTADERVEVAWATARAMAAASHSARGSSSSTSVGQSRIRTAAFMLRTPWRRSHRRTAARAYPRPRPRSDPVHVPCPQ